MMEKEVVIATNESSIYNILTNFAQSSLLFFAETDKETFGITVCAIFAIIGASSYIFCRVKDKRNKNLDNGNNERKNKLMKERELKKYSERQSSSNNFDYHRILSELHNACSNCSNIFSSMKCVQLVSNYPELINVKLFSDGVTPFHRICFHGNEPLIELMLAKGADPELRTLAGENALVMALYYYLYTEAKNFSCLNILHQKGCHLNCEDEWYEIFLNLSIRSNNKGLTKWLLTHSKRQVEKLFTRASTAPL